VGHLSDVVHDSIAEVGECDRPRIADADMYGNTAKQRVHLAGLKLQPTPQDHTTNSVTTVNPV
jgi:hypothetical protein